MEQLVKVKGPVISTEVYDEIIEENELITIEWWSNTYINGVNHFSYEAMCPQDHDEWDHKEMAEYITSAVHAMYDIEADRLDITLDEGR